MSESRAFLLGEVERVQHGGDAVAPSEEPIADPAGGPGAGDEGEVDEQDEERADQSVALPDTWPLAFWNALTPEAQREFERGDHDLVEEWDAWSRGKVDTGSPEPVLPAVELPMSADDVAEQVRLWTEIAQSGGDADTTAEEALAYVAAYRLQARATAIAEVHAGRRQAWDLSPEDQRDVLQAEIDKRVEAGRQRWGRDR